MNLGKCFGVPLKVRRVYHPRHIHRYLLSDATRRLLQFILRSPTQNRSQPRRIIRCESQTGPLSKSYLRVSLYDKAVMTRSLFFILLCALALPSFAKPPADKHPTSCEELWPAVTQTLGDLGNYKVIALDNEQMKANFIIVGALFSQMDLVELKPRNGGCDLQLKIGFTGNDDEAAFRKRVNRALKKLYAAKPPAHPNAGTAD